MALLADFAPRRIVYAGSLGEHSFVSGIDDGQLVVMNLGGEILERWSLGTAVDRVLDVEGTLLGLSWEYAWGRRWGRTTLGATDEAKAIDVRTSRKLWRVEGLWGHDGRLGIASEFAFDLLTGKRLWSLDARDCVIAFDVACVFALYQDSTIKAFDRTSGRVTWRYQPSERLRVTGFLGRSLALFDGGLWYVAHPDERRAVVVRLDPRTGKIDAEYDFPKYVTTLHATAGGILLNLGDQGTAIMFADGTTDQVTRHAVKEVATDGRGFALLGHDYRVDWAIERELSSITLNEPWSGLYLDGNGYVTIAKSTRLVRFGLGTPPFTTVSVGRPGWDSDEEFERASVIFAGPSIVLAEHPTRGRFTLHAPNTGLTKGGTVMLGGFVPGPTHTTFATKLRFIRGGETVTVTMAAAATTTERIGAIVQEGAAKKRSTKKKAAAATGTPIRRLIDSLVKDGLIDAMTDSAQKKMAKRVFPDGKVGDDGKALLLQYVHGLTGGLSRGFLAHDRRFERETDDVIAELSSLLGDVPVAFEQVGRREGAIHVRAQREERWLEGLPAIVAFMNDRLASAGCKTRIETLKTSDDWFAFVVSRR